MLLFHAVFASAAAATSASLSSALLGHVWLREVDISVPPKKIHYPFMLVWKHHRYYYFRI